MLVEYLLHSLGELAQAMKAVGDLYSGGGRLTRPVCVGGRARRLGATIPSRARGTRQLS
jgi:hypothetical protein